MAMYRLLSAALFLSLVGVVAHAQTAVPAGQGDPFKDTSMLKPPPGVRVAIIEWEDPECPACAHAFPIVHAAIAHYKIPLIRHDFQIHRTWGPEAMLYARYLEDKVSPEVATDYRRQYFAAQYQIASMDDLHNFTVKFFQANHQQIPFVLDPTGQLEREVDADKALGEKLGLQYTPCIIVATHHEWVHVTDVSQLYQTIDELLAKVGGAGMKPASVKKAAQAGQATH